MMRFLVLATAFLSACAPRLEQASSRNPDLFEKEGSMAGFSRAPESRPSPEMYVRQRDIALKRIDQPNETGSLFNPEDERNYLFTSAGPHKIGRYVNVKLATNLKKDAKPADDKKKAENAAADAAKDDMEKELLAALPDLAPAEPGDTKLIDHFKMRLSHRFENGDVLATMTRRSLNGDQAGEVNVTARIPYDRLMSGDELTTDDLLDVKMVTSEGGELAEARSSGWENEYSLRLSGFEEAKSKTALDIEDKRKKLEDARENLRGRIKSFGDERRQVAKQREDLQKQAAAQAEQKKQMEEKIAANELSLKEKDETIAAQTEEITALENSGDDSGEGDAKKSKTPPKPNAGKKDVKFK